MVESVEVKIKTRKGVVEAYPWDESESDILAV
jgi:hypothetical protein